MHGNAAPADGSLFLHREQPPDCSHCSERALISVALQKTEHHSHLVRLENTAWFWVWSRAACGLFPFFGPCVIQRWWNLFICPSPPPPAGSNSLCVTAPYSFEIRLSACAVSGCISEQKNPPSVRWDAAQESRAAVNHVTWDQRKWEWGHSSWSEDVNWSNQETKLPLEMILLKMWKTQRWNDLPEKQWGKLEKETESRPVIGGAVQNGVCVSREGSAGCS